MALKGTYVLNCSGFLSEFSPGEPMKSNTEFGYPPLGNKCPKWQCWVPKELLDHNFFSSLPSSRSFFYETEYNMKTPNLRKKKKCQRPEWWLTAVTSALRKQRQEENGKFKTSPGYIVKWGQPATGEPSSKEKKKKWGKKETGPKSQFLTLLKCKPDLCSPFWSSWIALEKYYFVTSYRSGF